MKRIMGIDYGDARTGVAISDLLCSIVGTTYVVPSRIREKAVADIVRLARDNDVGAIVVGLPKNMDGTEGPGRLCAGNLQKTSGRLPAWKLPCGTNGAPRWRPTTSSPSTITTAKSGKTLWTRWRPL